MGQDRCATWGDRAGCKGMDTVKVSDQGGAGRGSGKATPLISLRPQEGRAEGSG